MDKNQGSKWNEFTHWYDGWMGKKGGKYHQRVLIPPTIHAIGKSRQVLDLGCGTGVLAGHLNKKVSYTGIDLSEKMIDIARKNHPDREFICASSMNPKALPAGTHFATVTMLMALEDMEDHHKVISNISNWTTQGSEVIITMRHPCFNIPRLSGWQFDENRKISSRKVDKYLDVDPIPVNSKTRDQVSWTYHRSLTDIMQAFASNSFSMIDLFEIRDKIDQSNTSIPAFITLKFKKVG